MRFRQAVFGRSSPCRIFSIRISSLQISPNGDLAESLGPRPQQKSYARIENPHVWHCEDQGAKSQTCGQEASKAKEKPQTMKAYLGLIQGHHSNLQACPSCRQLSSSFRTFTKNFKYRYSTLQKDCALRPQQFGVGSYQVFKRKKQLAGRRQKAPPLFSGPKTGKYESGKIIRFHVPFWVAIMYATPVMVMLTMPLKLCIPLKLVQQFIQGCKGHYHTAGVVHVSVRIRPANTAWIKPWQSGPGGMSRFSSIAYSQYLLPAHDRARDIRLYIEEIYKYYDYDCDFVLWKRIGYRHNTDQAKSP